MPKENLNQVNYIRAIASLSVAVFHIVCGVSTYLPIDNLVRLLSSFGYLGLYMFFILTGFIIPFSLPQNYRLLHFPTYLKKRLVRIEPPYLASILLLLILEVASATARGAGLNVGGLQLLYHVAYLNNFLGEKFLNPVYWTLGVEFQFYLVIGLLFSTINKNTLTILASTLLLCALSFYNSTFATFLFSKYGCLFAFGLLTFYHHIGKITSPIYLGFSILIMISMYWVFGGYVVVTALLTAYILYFIKKPNRLIDFLSKISFSLYLIHCPVGGKIINLSTRFATSLPARYLTILLAIAASLLVAYYFYLYIEKPFMKFSKRLSYNIHNFVIP
jgi:peptidoglycan/LPS O-acetylase OafA/YrhL